MRMYYKGLFIETSYKSGNMMFIDIYREKIQVASVYVEANYYQLMRETDGINASEILAEGEMEDEQSEEEFQCMMADYYLGGVPIGDTSEPRPHPTRKDPRMSHARI